jgi:hypothetical protein
MRCCRAFATTRASNPCILGRAQLPQIVDAEAMGEFVEKSFRDGFIRHSESYRESPPPRP